MEVVENFTENKLIEKLIFLFAIFFFNIEKPLTFNKEYEGF